MPSDAFFVEPAAVRGDRALLAGEELRHARTVLRMTAGDEAELLDGEGGRYRARFLTSSRGDGEMEVLSRAIEPPPALALTLALALIRGERFEWALQKACELGVSEVIPLVTARSEVRPPRSGKGAEAEPKTERTERLLRIVASACKQCGRARFLGLLPPAPIAALDPAKYGRAVVLWEAERSRPLAEALGPGPISSCLLVVGPEGGLTAGEVGALAAKGAVAALLGPRILRTETAALAGTTLVQYLAGDLTQGAKT